MNFNFNEVGQVIRINLGKDISASIPTLILQPEIGQTKEIMDGVTVGLIDAQVGDEIFYADEYIEYTTKLGDLNYTGRWKKKAKLEFSLSNIEQTNFAKFRVLP